MSSIRPLATITLLALVGVFLYLKINETEPQLPPDIANWTMPSQLDIGTPSTPGGLAPSINPAPPATSSAPTFTPAPTTTAPAATTSAHTFTSAPPAFQPQITVAPAAKPPLGPELGAEGQAPVASDAPPLDIPNLPPLPTIPAAGNSATTTPTTTPTTTAPTITSSPAVGSPVKSDTQAAVQQSSLFAATRTAVQAALDRGELSQALLLLSDWYGDPSLSPTETKEVNELLGQLAGSVIYSTEHRLEPPYMVQAGEQLPDIAKKFNVPWQLLAKINGLSEAEQVQPGQQLKVIRGPFSALVDLSERRLTLLLDRRYAGQFPVELDPTTTVEDGEWAVNQKLLTPGSAIPLSPTPSASDQKSIMITSATGGANQIVIIRGASPSTPATTDPAGRVIKLKPQDADDVYDILSLGSPITIRR